MLPNKVSNGKMANVYMVNSTMLGPLKNMVVMDFILAMTHLNGKLNGKLFLQTVKFSILVIAGMYYH